MKRFVTTVICAFVLYACASGLSDADRKEILGHGAALTKCQLEARAAHGTCEAADAGSCDPLARDTYEACKARSGL